MSKNLGISREHVDASTPHDDRTPRYAQTVPRQLVHRAAIAEVLLTDWWEQGEDVFVVAVQWPRSHAFYEPIGPGYADPLLVAETIRQIGVLLGHAEYGVPADYRFILGDLRYHVRPAGIEVGARPLNLEIHVKGQDLVKSSKALGGMRVDATLMRDGQPIGEASGLMRCLSPVAFQLVRGREDTPVPPLLPPPVEPAAVGRDRVRDVVLSPTPHPGKWLLRADVDHPILFDHPLDHVPGMLLMEAMRQAALIAGRPGAANAALPAELTAGFHRFAELDEPCLVSAVPLERGQERGAGRTVAVNVRQGGQFVAEAVVTLTFM